MENGDVALTLEKIFRARKGDLEISESQKRERKAAPPVMAWAAVCYLDIY